MTPNNAHQQLQDLAVQNSFKLEMMFLPDAWNQARNWLRSNPKNCNWQTIDFPPQHQQRSSLPRTSGVYIFTLEPNIFDLNKTIAVLYIGKAKNIYTRINSYIRELNIEFIKSDRPSIWRMINQWNGELKYYYMNTQNVEEAEIFEKEMIKAFRPFFNTQYDAETSPFMRAFK
jgi:hypothetical protein